MSVAVETIPVALSADEASASTDEDSSLDSERFHSMDVDSGNSTAHSPDGPKSMSPQPGHQGEFLRSSDPKKLHYEECRQGILFVEFGRLTMFGFPTTISNGGWMGTE
jgi:hypothetical protein